MADEDAVGFDCVLRRRHTRPGRARQAVIRLSTFTMKTSWHFSQLPIQQTHQSSMALLGGTVEAPVDPGAGGAAETVPFIAGAVAID